MLTQAQFVVDVESYLARRPDLTATAFGRTAVNDPNFVFDLRRGRSPSLAIVERVLVFMRDHPPADEPKPAEDAA